MVRFSPVVVMSMVGTMIATSPVDADLAQPAPHLSLRTAVDAAPYMYAARRAIAGPA